MATQPASIYPLPLGIAAPLWFGGGLKASVAYSTGAIYYVNRGRTAESVFVYWESPHRIDSIGMYYPYTNPPFGGLIDIAGVGKFVR